MSKRKFDQYYKYRTYLVNAIVNTFMRVRKLAYDENLITKTSDSRSMLIPILLLIPVIYYFGGNYKVEGYTNLLIIGLISPHLVFAFFFFLESYFKDYSNFSDPKILQARIDFFERYALSWHESKESKFIRFGLFLGFLLISYTLMCYSIILNKPIEYCLFKYANFGLICDKEIMSKAGQTRVKEKSLDENFMAEQMTKNEVTKDDIYDRYWMRKDLDNWKQEPSFNDVKSWLLDELDFSKIEVENKFPITLEFDTFVRSANNQEEIKDRYKAT